MAILGDFLRRFLMDLFFLPVTEAAGLFFAASSAPIASAEVPVVVACEPVLATGNELTLTKRQTNAMARHILDSLQLLLQLRGALFSITAGDNCGRCPELLF